MISYLDYPFYSGLSRRINGLSVILKKNGIKVKILAPIARNNGANCDIDVENIVVERIDLRRFASKDPDRPSSKLVLWLLFTVWASFKAIKENLRNHYLIQYQSFYSSLPAVVAKLAIGAPIVGDDVVLINPFVDASLLKLTDVVVTPSLRTCSFANVMRKESLYIPNGVNTDLSRNGTELSDHRSDFTILVVGALSFDQNLMAVEKVINIAACLEAKGVLFKILIVGGPLSRASHFFDHRVVRTLKVEFLGTVLESRLRELCLSSFIGLLPFFNETPLVGGQRTKALEFFANGLLVISGPEGVKGIHGLEPGKHFLMAESVDKMCELLEACISRPAEFKLIAVSGQKHVCDNCSWKSLTGNYVGVIGNLISKDLTSGD
jgi:glycosyltransferase involved in cell wall biosynthesis